MFNHEHSIYLIPSMVYITSQKKCQKECKIEKKRNVEYCLLFRTCLVSGVPIDYGELYKIGPFNLPS